MTDRLPVHRYRRFRRTSGDSDRLPNARTREALLSRIIDSAMDAIISIDERQRIVLFNRAAQVMFGATAREMLGQPLSRLLPDRYRHAHTDHIEQFSAAGVTQRSMRSPGMLIARRLNGQEFPIEATISQAEIDGQKTYTVIMRDISERLTVERALHRTENDAQQRLAELEATYNTAPIGLAVLDTHLRYVRINTRLAEINGLPADQHIGRTPSEVVPQIAEVFDPLLRRVIATGEPLLDFEVSGTTPAQPNTVRHWMTHTYPLRDSRGKITGVNIVAEEITERKQAEERADRLKLQFLGMVSHELRTPLTPIKGFVSTMMDTSVDWDEETRQSFLSIVDEETDKLIALVEQLLDLSRLQAGTLRVMPEPMSILDVIAVAYIQLATLTSAHRLEIDIDDGLPRIFADVDRIAQVLVNLVGNAVKYSPAGTTIRLTAERDGEHACLMVSDQGVGIPDSQKAQVFEVFQQGNHAERTVAKGAGLGLAICKGIVEAHGGRIWVEDNTPVGTSVSFTLPVVPESVIKQV